MNKFLSRCYNPCGCCGLKLNSKNTLISLDDLDIKILTILMEDSRISLNKIAERLGVSVSTVSARVKKMENKGIIDRYTVYIDCRKLGFKNIAFILIKTTGGNERVIRELKKIPNIRAIYETAGAFDILIQGIALDVDTLEELIKEIKGIEGVIEVNTLLVLKINKEDTYPDPSCLVKAINYAIKHTID